MITWRIHIFWTVVVVAALLAAVAPFKPAYALNAGETYTVSLYEVNGDGSTSLATSTTATANSSGKLSFTLNNVPTNAQANFLYFTIADSSDSVVRKGFSPAPPAGQENLLGINSLSTSQAAAMITAGQVAGTDDPILVAFGLVLTRSPGITDADITRIVTVGNAAIRGQDGDSQGAGLGAADGFIGFLKDKGVTNAQLNLMRDKLVYNSTAGTKDLRSFTALFKDAVDNGDDGEMSKAGGYMAEIFIDAGNSAGIDPGLILSAHNAAGEVTNKAAYSAILAAMDSSVMRGIEQSMSSFFTRAAAAKLETEYNGALSTLNTPAAEVAAYNTAVQTMVTSFETIETTYVDYFMDPDGYVAANSTTHNAVQNTIDTAFNTAFTNFQSDVASSNAYITSMKTAVATALGINLTDPPLNSADFGKECPFGSDCSNINNWVNWSIPQTAMVTWVANIITAGGSMGYTRDTLTVPTNMGWLNGTGARADYIAGAPSTGNASFDAFQGLQEDIKIIEFAKWDAWSQAAIGGATPEQLMALEKAQGALFEQRLDAAAARITGTTDGATAIAADEKAALVQLLIQPSLH
jgi:hypothetical protein